GGRGRWWDGLVRAVLLDEHVGVDAALLEAALAQRLDAHPLLRARHLVAVDGVDELLQVPREAPGRAAGLGETLGDARARGLGRLSLLSRQRERGLQAGEGDVGAVAYCAGHRAL